MDDSRKWWKARNRRGITGHVPHTIVAPHAPQDVFSNPLYSTHYPPQVRYKMLRVDVIGKYCISSFHL